LAYDVDAAGQRAGAFGARELGALVRAMALGDSGVELDDVRVARLPDGKDPDEVIRESADAWKSAIARAQPIVDYLIDQAAEERDLRTAAGKDRFVRAVLPVVDALPPVMRASYEERIRRMSGVEEWLLHEARRAQRSPASSAGGPRITADAVLQSDEALPVREILRAISPTETELLRLLLLVPDQQLRVVDLLGPDQLPSTLARELYRAIVLMRAPDERGIPGQWDRDALLAGLDEETHALARAIYAQSGPEPGDLTGARIEYEVENLLLDLEADRIEERNQYNLAEQTDAERRGEAELMERLLTQHRQINEERRSLDRRRDQARLFARPVAGRS
jgi:DNA primase